MPPIYRYSFCAYICELSIVCPYAPQTYEDLAYCFIHQDEAHPNNFKAKACQSPKRIANAQNQQAQCDLLGLSFFENKAKAIALFIHQNNRTKGKFSNENGTLLAAVLLTPHDGFYDKASYNSSSTHFNFFEVSTCIFREKIQNKEEL